MSKTKINYKLYKNNKFLKEFELSKEITTKTILAYMKRKKPDKIIINNIIGFIIRKDFNIDKKLFKKKKCIRKSKNFEDIKLL